MLPSLQQAAAVGSETICAYRRMQRRGERGGMCLCGHLWAGLLRDLTLLLHLAVRQVLHFFPGAAPAGCGPGWQPAEQAWHAAPVCVTEYY